MNEIPPPSEPGPVSPQPPAFPGNNKRKPPSKKVCTALGALLFLVSCGLCYVTPFAALIGVVIAFGSLFFEGYRCILLGYALTFGVILLAAIIYCFTQPFDIK
jgi:hypothetical protein